MPAIHRVAAAMFCVFAAQGCAPLNLKHLASPECSPVSVDTVLAAPVLQPLDGQHWVGTYIDERSDTGSRPVSAAIRFVSGKLEIVWVESGKDPVRNLLSLDIDAEQGLVSGYRIVDACRGEFAGHPQAMVSAMATDAVPPDMPQTLRIKFNPRGSSLNITLGVIDSDDPDADGSALELDRARCGLFLDRWCEAGKKVSFD